MIRTTRNGLARLLVSAMALTIECWAAGSFAQAPIIEPASPEDPKLDTKIGLSLDSVTLSTAAAEIAKQASVTLIVAPSIQDRKLTMHTPSSTTRQVLDVLCETYDWRWYRQSPGGYVLDRRSFRKPQDPAAIPAMMQAALPMDIRVFASLPNLKVKAKNPEERTGYLAADKVKQIKFRAADRFRLSLTGVFNTRDSFSIQEMSPRQRDDLLAWLTFANLDRSMEMLHNDYAPHQMDIKHIVLKMEQWGLDVMTTADVKPGFGFGTAIFFADGRPVP